MIKSGHLAENSPFAGIDTGGSVSGKNNTENYRLHSNLHNDQEVSSGSHGSSLMEDFSVPSSGWGGDGGTSDWLKSLRSPGSGIAGAGRSSNDWWTPLRKWLGFDPTVN